MGNQVNFNKKPSLQSGLRFVAFGIACQRSLSVSQVSGVVGWPEEKWVAVREEWEKPPKKSQDANALATLPLPIG